jgi:hypothetical protein
LLFIVQLLSNAITTICKRVFYDPFFLLLFKEVRAMQNTDTTRGSGIKGREKERKKEERRLFIREEHRRTQKRLSLFSLLSLTVEHCARSEERNTRKETGGQFAHL